MKALITGSSFYDYQDKEGNRKKGGAITYLTKNASGQTSEALGYGAVSLQVPHETKQVFSKGVGVYELETSIQQKIMGMNVSLQNTFVSAEFVRGIDINSLIFPKVA